MALTGGRQAVLSGHGCVVVVGGQDEVGRRRGARPWMENLKGEPVIAGGPLHVALAGVGPSVVGADSSVARRCRRRAAGRADADAVLAAGAVIAPDLFAQICAPKEEKEN